MPLDRRRLRVLLITAVGVVSAALGLTLGGTGALDGAETIAVDQRFQIRGVHDVPDKIVVVGIDDTTLAVLPNRPPFKRSLHAKVIDNLTAAGARTIVYDIQFSELTEALNETDAVLEAANAEDQALLEAIATSKKVVLGTSEVFDNGEPNVLPDYEDAAKGAVGVANFAEADFSHIRASIDGLPSLAAATVAKATGRPVDLRAEGGDGAWIDYHGRDSRTSAIPSISFSRVLANTFARSDVNDKIVVVGNTANRLGDVHPTPFGGLPMSGPEIQANAISTILRNAPLRDASGWLNIVTVIGLVGAATSAALRRSALLGILIAAGLIAGFLVVAQLVFNRGRILDVAAPVLATALAGVTGLVINYWFVVRDRARLRTAFARFLPAPIVDDVLEEAGENGRLGGRRLYATVMFADLRGFTAAAERLPPEAVIDVLNRYLTEMSDAVLDHGGTLVAYQGDGLMAVFGAPIEQADHADRALDAAREMRDVRLPRFNGWTRTAGIVDDFRMGIGLASGPVMSGNVGSERRLEYAAVGDTTNTAARLEALTKETPHMLLIADTTRAAASRAVPDLTAVGSLDVRGRQVPASVWTLAEMRVGPADADPTPPQEAASD